MPKLVSSGLAGLDALFGGGIPPGTVQLCFGQPMNALDLMPYHFAAAGTRAQGALYFTTTTEEKEVQSSVAMVGGEAKRLEVIELPHDDAWLPAELEPGIRVVIDRLSDVIEATSFKGVMEVLADLKKDVRKGGQNLLVMVTEGMLKDREMVILKEWADGVMELGFDRQGFGLYPFLKVSKMRGIPDASRIMLVKETERGLTLDSTKRVF